MAKGAGTGFDPAAIAVGVLLILLQFKVNPALLILGCGILGAFLFLPK